MQCDHFFPSTQSDAAVRDQGSPTWLRFAMLCTLFLLASVWLEPLLLPLNRIVALLSEHLLTLYGYTPVVRGDLMTLSGFTVRIVLECTALHPILVYAAFVLAQPASLRLTLVALTVGSGVLILLNIMRIAVVTVVGAKWPLFFEISHVYLGQVAMLLLVLAAALVWQRISSGGQNPLPFILRSMLWASLLFLPWVVLNKFYYMHAVDTLVSWIFASLFQRSDVTIVRPLALYNYTFSLPLYFALVIAMRGTAVARRIMCTVSGGTVLVGWHFLCRSTHVAMNVFDLSELLPLHLAVYLVGQFLIPIVLWFYFFGQTRRSGTESLVADTGAIGTKTSSLLLLGVLILPSSSWAEPLLTMKSSGVNAYQLDLKGLERISRATITLEYVLQGATPAPRLIPSGLGGFGSLKIDSSHSNGDAHSMKIVYVAAAPLSRDGTLGSLTLTRGDAGGARVAGMNVSAEMQDVKGQTIQARVEIDDTQTTSEPVKTPPITGSAKSDGIIKRRSVKSVLEQFRAYDGRRTAEVLAGLVSRSSEGEYLQEPPLLISDGAATVRMVFRQAATYKDTPRFLIKGADFIGFTWLDSGELAVDLLPEKDALKANITIITGDEYIEYPLAVSPALDQFDVAATEPEISDFVRAANDLMNSDAVR
jgi:exosortase/archaeosortase family protein